MIPAFLTGILLYIGTKISLIIISSFIEWKVKSPYYLRWQTILKFTY